MTSKGAWRVPHDVGVVFCLCGFCIARKKKSVLGKKTSKRQSGHEEDPRKAPCAAWDRFSFRADDRCTPGNILKGLNWRWWNMGSNTGSCCQAECGYRQHGPLETQENTLMSKVCPSKAGIQIWAPTPSPRNGAVEAGTLGKHLHQPWCYPLAPVVPQLEFVLWGLPNNAV